MGRLFLSGLFLLFLYYPSFTQAPPADRDSVRALVEQVIRQKQDSLKAARQLEKIKKNSKPLDVFLQEMRDREKAERRRRWIGIGAGVFFFSLLLITSVRRYRARHRR